MYKRHTLNLRGNLTADKPVSEEEGAHSMNTRSRSASGEGGSHLHDAERERSRSIPATRPKRRRESCEAEAGGKPKGRPRRAKRSLRLALKRMGDGAEAGAGRLGLGKGRDGALRSSRLATKRAGGPPSPRAATRTRGTWKRRRTRVAAKEEADDDDVGRLEGTVAKWVMVLRDSAFKLRALTERWRGTESVELDERNVPLAHEMVSAETKLAQAKDRLRHAVDALMDLHDGAALQEHQHPADAVCAVCRSGHASDDNDIILCDYCDTPYHASCHNPQWTMEDARSEELWCRRCNLLFDTLANGVLDSFGEEEERRSWRMVMRLLDIPRDSDDSSSEDDEESDEDEEGKGGDEHHSDDVDHSGSESSDSGDYTSPDSEASQSDSADSDFDDTL